METRSRVARVRHLVSGIGCQVSWSGWRKRCSGWCGSTGRRRALDVAMRSGGRSWNLESRGRSWGPALDAESWATGLGVGVGRWTAGVGRRGPESQYLTPDTRRPRPDTWNPPQPRSHVETEHGRRNEPTRVQLLHDRQPAMPHPGLGTVAGTRRCLVQSSGPRGRPARRYPRRPAPGNSPRRLQHGQPPCTHRHLAPGTGTRHPRPDT